MDDFKEYKIIKTGNIKYNRLRSMSILRNELNSFGYEYSLNDIKNLFGSILSSSFNESFNGKIKKCIDTVFDNMEYERTSNYECEEGASFPDNWIPPFG